MQQKPFLSSDMIESASWKWNKWKLIPNPRTWTISNSDLLLVCYPSMGLRWAHRAVEILSLRIHLPNPPDPPFSRYHDNIDRSLQLKKQGRSDPVAISLLLSPLSILPWHSLPLFISQSVSTHLPFHRGERKWDIMPQKINK